MPRTRVSAALAVTGLLAACAAPKVVAPPVVATLGPPPPVLPAGAYDGMAVPAKLDDGRYVTPNISMTDAAAVWHLRGALNVAALACDKVGVETVAPYNAWLAQRRAVLAARNDEYVREWEQTGWGDWRDAYDNAQTRLYNFYGQPAIRIAFCRAAAAELATIGTVDEAALPAHARAALDRLDRPFITFFRSYEAWRAYYQPKVTPPALVATVPAPAPEPQVVAAAAPAAVPPALLTPPQITPPRLTVDPQALDER